MDVEPFTIEVPDEVLTDLTDRIRNTRWPEPSPAAAWKQGTDLAYLRDLAGYWADRFDWRAQERWLNGFAHFRADVDGTRIHFVHQRAVHGDGIPLVLTHGWPSCFVEYLSLVPLLTDPAAHGIAGPAFDLVIPSLPGYGFSDRPPRPGVTTRDTARLWHRLMHGIGHQRYGATGGDFGSAVSSFLALHDPESMIGLHLSNLDLAPFLGPGTRAVSQAERAYVRQYEQWAADDRGYGVIQATRPQTLAYALQDSPTGLAAWIAEKWRAWTDSGGDLESVVPRDLLLTVVTLYWVTGTIGTSIRDYVDNRATALGPDDRVRVPTGFANFARQFVDDGDPPQEWVERIYDVVRWTPMPRGGHFASAEQPDLLARDIAEFFAGL